jgi:dTDP-4-amino-4,6-dideoxygalactose transaminase
LKYTPGDFPVSEKVTSEILSLPMYPQLQADQQQKVAEAVTEFVASRHPAMAALAAKALG